jgi:nucleoside-triphosphatase
VASALLLSGPPGVGKTTVIRRAAEAVGEVRLAGFTTDELREGRTRVGFEIVTFDGRAAVMAHVSLSSPHQVGRYAVDIDAFERIALETLALNEPIDVYVVDEIGKMECLSLRFVRTIERLLRSGRPIVATVGVRGDGLISEVKQRPDVEVWQVTRQNRDVLPLRVASWINGHVSGANRRR